MKRQNEIEIWSLDDETYVYQDTVTGRVRRERMENNPISDERLAELRRLDEIAWHEKQKTR